MSVITMVECLIDLAKLSDLTNKIDDRLVENLKSVKTVLEGEASIQVLRNEYITKLEEVNEVSKRHIDLLEAELKAFKKEEVVV